MGTRKVRLPSVRVSLPPIQAPPPFGLSWSVWSVVAAWCVQGVTFLVAGTRMATDESLRGAFDDMVVSAALGRPVAIALAVFGLLSCMGGVLVVAGQAYAHSALVVVGIVGILCCLLTSSSAAFVALAAAVIAVVLGLTTNALDHLYPASAPAPDEP